MKSYKKTRSTRSKIKENTGILHKLNENTVYTVYVQNNGAYKFYKIRLKKNKFQGDKVFYKRVKFLYCEPPENGDKIRIIKGYENLYENEKDKYNDIVIYIITSYEKIESDSLKDEEAIEIYKKNISDQSDVEIDIDDLLPF